MGKLLIVVGIICILAGILINYADRLPFAGRLPGDVVFEKSGFRFYFPFTTCILISVFISALLYFINRVR